MDRFNSRIAADRRTNREARVPIPTYHKRSMCHSAEVVLTESDVPTTTSHSPRSHAAAHQAKQSSGGYPRKVGKDTHRRQEKGGQGKDTLSIGGEAGGGGAGRRAAAPARKRSVGGSIGAVEFCRSDGQSAVHACRVRSGWWCAANDSFALPLP